ncbi:MAG: hypothetical protein HW420_1393, partial [Candidatus Nitrosotenuis sp.]|nr:hypothetical protein [Candidatus Nitrosotenuis sp.]
MSDKEISKIHNIAEILGMLDETHRGKDWLLQEIKKHHVKVEIKYAMNSFEILKICPDDFVSLVARALKGEDIEGFEDIKILTKTYHWFFTDIVAGSNPTIPTKDQVRKIIVLNEVIARTSVFANKDPKSTVILPTGDGMAIGFSDSPEKPLRLAVEIHKALSRYNQSKIGKEKLLIRVGIDMGPVYVIKDLNGQDNVWGPGIILTRRVMDLAGDMQIFASERIANDIRNLSPEYKEIMHPIGDYAIKHGEQLKLYNIYGEGFGNKNAARKNKLQKSTLERDIKNVNNFSFNKIEVIIEVQDLATMMAHHAWVWNVMNISKEPKSQIFYYLDGDVPRDFADMNVAVKDENGNKLDILSVNVNKPYHKEFIVQMNRPIKPKQKKILILEYDWEEPERNYFYKFASNCKEFNYRCTIPKGMELKTRVIKVDTETGYKIHATPPPSV